VKELSPQGFERSAFRGGAACRHRDPNAQPSVVASDASTGELIPGRLETAGLGRLSSRLDSRSRLGGESRLGRPARFLDSRSRSCLGIQAGEIPGLD
jgi:hypothetical protein